MKEEKLGAIDLPVVPEELTGEAKKEWLLTKVFPGVSGASLLSYINDCSERYQKIYSYLEANANKKNTFLLPLLLAYIRDYDEVYQLYGDPDDRLVLLRELVFKKDDSFIQIVGDLSSTNYRITQFIGDNQYERSNLIVEPNSITIVTYKVEEYETGIVVEETFKSYAENTLYEQYQKKNSHNKSYIEFEGNTNSSLMNKLTNPVLSYVNSERHVYSREMIIQSCDEYNADNYQEISYPGLNFEGLIARTINLQIADNDTKVTPDLINKVIIDKKDVTDRKAVVMLSINDATPKKQIGLSSVEEAYKLYQTEELPPIKRSEEDLLKAYKEQIMKQEQILRKKPFKLS